MDPEGEAARYGISLNKDLPAGTISAAPKQVLALNADLNEAADAHSNWMLSTDNFSHTGSGGSDPGDRMRDAGYVFSGNWSWGENIAWSGTTGTLDPDAAAVQHHRNLFLSSGHRKNILNDYFREAGVGSIDGRFTSGSNTYNALVTTENFATSGPSFFVTGVAYNDADNDDFYSIGEARSGVKVDILKNGAVATSSLSGTAGGYAAALASSAGNPVDVEVRFSGGGLSCPDGRRRHVGGLQCQGRHCRWQHHPQQCFSHPHAERRGPSTCSASGTSVPLAIRSPTRSLEIPARTRSGAVPETTASRDSMATTRYVEAPATMC